MYVGESMRGRIVIIAFLGLSDQVAVERNSIGFRPGAGARVWRVSSDDVRFRRGRE